MTSINPINVNAQGIGGSYGFSAKSKTEEKEAKKPEVDAQPQGKAVPADDVLTYMAQSAVAVAPKPTTVDPTKYVDEASAQRIAGFMSSFEDKVAEGLAAFDKEFAGAQVSDSAKMAVVLAGIDKES